MSETQEPTLEDLAELSPQYSPLEKETSALHKFAVDTGALITFSIAIGMANEILIAGLTFGQSIQSRLTSIPINFVIGRPYGKFRDYVFRKFNVNEYSGELKKIAADTSAFVSFQMPVYGAILYSVGAETEQIATAITSVTITSAIIGRPYGWYLDTMRSMFRVNPEYMKH